MEFQVQPYCSYSLGAYLPRTDGQTDRRRAQFPAELFDNHPFGVW